jgi:hypothetical protein
MHTVQFGRALQLNMEVTFWGDRGNVLAVTGCSRNSAALPQGHG